MAGVRGFAEAVRTREQIEAQQSDSTASISPKKFKRGEHPNSRKNLVAPWKPGQSGHPGGSRKDVAQEIARAVFENNPEALYQAYARVLLKGGAFAFQVLADRAFGKLKETKEIQHTYQDVADGELEQRISGLLKDLGLATEIDAAGRIGITQAGKAAQGLAAKDS